MTPGEKVQEEWETYSAEKLVDLFLGKDNAPKACITSSFQEEDMVVLHLLRQKLPGIPVIFLDTGYHFPEVYQYRDRMTHDWQLNLINATPLQSVPEQERQLGLLYLVNPTECCRLRKVEPLARSLAPYDLWFTGLRREQSPSRKNLRKIELHRLPSGKELKKVSLLADWTWEQVRQYTQDHEIPRLPLYDQGYRSIGCKPCTKLPADPSNPRSGRWGGKKLECGIHTFSEKEQ
jgi:phosphoadenosine phosphosulfate reductase